MRRVLLLLVVVAVVLAVAAGMAWAVSITCPTSGDCIGSREADTLTGGSGFQRIAGLEGSDIISGGGLSDEIHGDEANDTTDVQEGDGSVDTVFCGPGIKDKVFFDQGFDTVTGCKKKNPVQ